MKESNVYLEDCMIGMARYPDKYFDLAIVDPPYGININHNMGRRKGHKHSGHKKVKWDNETPNDGYFDELFRVSKNQIIWGGNYFKLPLTGAWLFWDKIMPFDLSFSMGELAWMSIGKTIRKVELRHHRFINSDTKKIHPTQKPIALYKWLLHNYAKQGDKILDTHLGSGSSRIAAYDMGFDFTAFELDKEYFEAQEKRFNQFKSQLKLF
jgi:site-specific DNA-methyltransferase (adenine-specific)